MAQLPNLPGFIRDKSGRLSVDKEATWIEDHDFSGDGYYGSDQDLLANAYMEYYERTNLPRGQLGGGNYIDRTYEQNDDGDDIAKYSLRYEPPPPPAPVRPSVPPAITPQVPGPPEVPRQPPQPAPAPQPAPKGPATPVPSWVTPPPPGSGTLQALETLTNPVTGETYTAPTSGYTVNTPAPQPAPAQQPTPQPPPATPRPTPAPPSEMEQKVVGETAAQAGIGTVPPVLDPQTQLTYTPQQPQQEEQFEPVTILDPLATTVEKASKTNLEIATPPRTNAQTYSAYVQEGTPEYAAAQGQPSSESLIGDIQGAVSQESIAQAAVGELDERATIRYQMDQLFDSFEEGKPPPAWAAPAVRKVGSMMAQRGLGKSSMAAAAITQAMMESGVQIAAQDANKYATIQLNNLNNQQKTALQNAMTFAAMDKANLDARMQAAVNNSRVFLQMDTANLTNQQQLKTIDLQQQYQKMFNDNAQENASRQFNAKSQMQVDQFFTELDTQVANANASRMAATEQFNADQANAATRYYSKLNDAREKLNVQLEAQISQANTVWRRQINTTNTAQQNFVNQQNALNLLGIQQSSMDKIWQRYRDEAQWALTVSENNAQRAHTAAILAQSNEFNAAQYEKESKDFMYTSMGGAVLKGVFGILGGGQTK